MAAVRMGLQRYRFGEWTLDQGRRELLHGPTPVHVSPKAFEFLVLLLARAPNAVSKQEIQERLWPQTFVSEANLTKLMAELRMALEDEARQPRFIRTVHGFGYAFCGEAATEAAHAALPEAAAKAKEDRSPYPGLAAFGEADAGWFFGREAEVEGLWAKLRRRKLLGLIGPSGVGKTSFLRAGLVPASPPGWACVVLTPGTRPRLSLAWALLRQLSGDVEAIGGLPGLEAAGIVAGFSEWRRRHAEALVVVDQFEELFTLNPPQIQAAFAGLLGRLVSESGVHLLISLRDDFLFPCHEHAALADVFTELTPLGPLRGVALEQALVEPARREGFEFEDAALVAEMLTAVEGERSALPPLAFAAARLWERRDRGRKTLTRAAYAEIGGVAGALARHAEAVLARIVPDEQPIVREVFRNLVSGRGTRALCDREELLSALPDRDTAWRVVRELIDARLLTSYALEGSAGEAEDHRIEIVHESLLTAWPRLVRWQAQDAEGALLRDQLKQAAHLWQEKGRPDDLLWSGASYREFRVWRERYPGRMTALEEEFARAMVARATRRRRRRRTAVAAVIAMLLAALTAIAVSRREAVEQARHARASRLAALGRLELDRYPSAAVAFARASLEIADNSEARLLAVEALWHGPPARLLPLSPGVAPMRAAFSPDGRRLALAGYGETVEVWSETGELLNRLEGNAVVADPRGVAFDPRGQRLLTYAPNDPSVRVFDPTGGLVETIPLEAQWIRYDEAGRLFVYGATPGGPQERALSVVEANGARPRTIAAWEVDRSVDDNRVGINAPTRIDPTSKWLVYGRDDRVFLHPLAESDARRDVEIGRHPARVRALLFHPDGERLFSVDDGGQMRTWSVSRRRLIASEPGLPLHRYSLLSLDSAGRRLAWFSGRDRVACVRDLDGPPTAAIRRLAQSDITDGGAPVFHPRGSWLVSPSYNTTALWPLSLPGSRIVLVHGDGPVRDLAFSPDSRMLASAARDGLYLVPLGPGMAPSRKVELELDVPYVGYGVAWLSSGREVALTAASLGIYLVPAAPGRSVPRKILDYPSQRIALGHLAFDADEQRLAVLTYYSPDASGKRVYVIDMKSGGVRALPIPPTGPGSGFQGQIRAVGFSAAGHLVTAGDGGIRRWDLASGSGATILGGRGTFATFALAADGRTAVAILGKDFDDLVTIRNSEVRVLDVETGAQRVLPSHGHRLTIAVATDPKGEIVVTGDSAGVVRVGSTQGGEPHLLLGHSGAVFSVAVSPDRRWIASGSGGEVRLWPMPDLSKPPLHTLPLDVLLAKLRALTNLEVVEDSASATGYRVAIGPFPGWKDVPTW